MLIITHLRYYSWKHSEMLRLGCGGWVTETGDSQLPLLDAWQVQQAAWRVPIKSCARQSLFVLKFIFTS